MKQDLQGTWDHSLRSCYKALVYSPVFWNITFCLIFIPNFQERRNPNLKPLRNFLARRRKKSLKVPREKGDWNQECPSAILTSLLRSLFRQINNLSLGKLRGGGGGWGNGKGQIARWSPPLAAKSLVGLWSQGFVSSLLVRVGSGAIANVACPEDLSLCSYVGLSSGLHRSVG